MIVVDTTVLVYAVGDVHEFREPCRELVAAIQRGDIGATTTAEVIQEFVHVRARRRSRDDAAGLGEAYLTMFSPLLVLEESDVRAGLDVFRRHSGLGSFDAMLAAAAISVDASALVSADRGFATVDDVHHVVPDEHGVSALITDVRP